MTDYGVAKSTNLKKVKKRKEERALAKKLDMQEGADNREKMQYLSDKKRMNFFCKLKRKREEDDPEEPGKVANKKKTRNKKEDVQPTMEDNLSSEPQKRNASQSNIFQNSTSSKPFQRGKAAKITEIARYFESKGNVRGQHSCLAKPTNENKQDNNIASLGTWHVIGGGLGGGSQPANDRQEKKS